MFGIGYLLGTKAGRDRYEQIRRLYRRATSNRAIRQAIDQGKDIVDSRTAQLREIAADQLRSAGAAIRGDDGHQPESARQSADSAPAAAPARIHSAVEWWYRDFRSSAWRAHVISTRPRPIDAVSSFDLVGPLIWLEDAGSDLRSRWALPVDHGRRRRHPVTSQHLDCYRCTPIPDGVRDQIARKSGGLGPGRPRHGSGTDGPDRGDVGPIPHLKIWAIWAWRSVATWATLRAPISARAATSKSSTIFVRSTDSDTISSIISERSSGSRHRFILLEHLGETDQSGQRRPKLVRDGRDQLVFGSDIASSRS